MLQCKMLPKAEGSVVVASPEARLEGEESVFCGTCVLWFVTLCMRVRGAFKPFLMWQVFRLQGFLYVSSFLTLCGDLLHELSCGNW